MSGDFGVVGLGRMPFEEALDLQRAIANARLNGAIERDLLLLVEHPPVITLGRGFNPAHLTTHGNELARRGIELHEIDRGGDVTYHGPGQLVGYPIFDLTHHKPDLHWFLRTIEEALILALSHLGIVAGRREGLTGVWATGRKIASIGIHVKNWVTWHGFALNVTTDLARFDLMVPCGIADVQMTSVQKELGSQTPRDVWGRALDLTVLGFAEAFGRTPQAELLDDIRAEVAG